MSEYNENVVSGEVTTGAALDRYVAVKTPTAAVATGAGEDCYGILQAKSTASGQQRAVRRAGLTKAICGGTVADDAEVMFDASGHIVTHSSTNYKVGKALEAGVDGQEILMFLYAKRVNE